MKPSASDRVLAQRFAKAQYDPSAFRVRDMVNVCLEFYRSTRATGLSHDPDSDMLLFQWGTYDWGDGKRFEVDLVRQFAKRRMFGDPSLSQLHATAYFEQVGFAELSTSDAWCHSLEDLDRFRNLVFASPAFQRTADLKPLKSEIRWELV